MWPFDRMKVRVKLALLAAVPVLGALLLSALIARDAQQRSASAAALGTIDDLAQLTDQMSQVVQRLQIERAQTAFSVGTGELDSAQLAVERARTDDALGALTGFLDHRDESKLPSKLKRDLVFARNKLTHLAEVRAKATQAGLRIEECLDFYATVNDAFIGATAALTQLSDDGDILRNIGRLVATMQVVERSSREHALLSYVFGRGEFPPGTFRSFVTLMTEKDVYAASLQTTVTDADFSRFQEILRGPNALRVEAMRKTALETTDEQLAVDAADWFTTQRATLAELGKVERETADTVRHAASRKVAETRGAVRLGIGLAVGVLLISSLIGWAIARSMTRSVHVLADATAAVQTTGDFAIRAAKTSSDELGLLTDAFNGMLAGIQERDRELEAHRENLSALVDARTLQLSERNEQMRLVLDSVEQGLVMIDRQGRLFPECSRVFAEWFGTPEKGAPFAAVLAGDDETTRLTFEQAFDQLIDDVLPLDLALTQMPTRLERDRRQFALSFQAVVREEKLDRTLLVVRDVTSELSARRAEAVQREKIKTFEHVMRDRFGFVEFFEEARGLAESIRNDAFPNVIDEVRAVHTLKGICGTFDVQSIAAAAHELEQALVDEDRDAADAAAVKVIAAWDAFCREIAPVLGDEHDAIPQMSRPELERIIAMVRMRLGYDEIERALGRLRHEPATLRFRRVEEQLRALARRQGKPEPTVTIDAGDVRIPIAPFREFWSAFSHIVRNTIDHGMENEQDREARGKLGRGRIELRARANARGLIIEIADDGRGIDWNKLAEKARERGLGHTTRAELVRAMFTDGISTASRVSEFSGRGVGMAVVRQACTALHGEIEVDSEPGRGARFRFVFPALDGDDAASTASFRPALNG